MFEKIVYYAFLAFFAIPFIAGIALVIAIIMA